MSRSREEEGARRDLNFSRQSLLLASAEKEAVAATAGWVSVIAHLGQKRASEGIVGGRPPEPPLRPARSGVAWASMFQACAPHLPQRDVVSASVLPAFFPSHVLLARHASLPPSSSGRRWML